MTINTVCDREKILSLWEEAFHDDKKYVNAFLDMVETNGNCFCSFLEDELVCMAFILDIPVRIDGRNIKSAYMYACATRKEHRGNGYFARLYQEIKKKLIYDGYEFVYCVPQTQELFDFYKKLGFNKTLYRNEICVSFDNKKSTMDFVEKHGNDAYEIYVNSLPKDLSCPLKNREVFEFSLFASGGNFYTFPCGYLVYDGQTVCEICTTTESMENILKNASRFFKRDLKAYTFFDVGEKEPYAVLCELSDSKMSDSVYANMLMD